MKHTTQTAVEILENLCLETAGLYPPNFAEVADKDKRLMVRIALQLSGIPNQLPDTDAKIWQSPKTVIPAVPPFTMEKLEAALTKALGKRKITDAMRDCLSWFFELISIEKKTLMGTVALLLAVQTVVDAKASAREKKLVKTLATHLFANTFSLAVFEMANSANYNPRLCIA